MKISLYLSSTSRSLSSSFPLECPFQSSNPIPTHGLRTLFWVQLAPALARCDQTVASSYLSCESKTDSDVLGASTRSTVHFFSSANKPFELSAYLDFFFARIEELPQRHLPDSTCCCRGPLVTTCNLFHRDWFPSLGAVAWLAAAGCSSVSAT